MCEIRMMIMMIMMIMMGLTIGSTWWMASGFCPRAASTVSVFSRNLWQRAPHMQTPRISATKCVSDSGIHFGDWKWWKCNWKISDHCKKWRATLGWHIPKQVHSARLQPALPLPRLQSAFLFLSDISGMRTLGSEKKTWSKNYGPASTSQPP